MTTRNPDVIPPDADAVRAAAEAATPVTALATRPERQVALLPNYTEQRTAYEVVVLWAKMFGQSGMFPDARSAAQAAVKIAIGMELGFSPAAAMQGVHIIEGRPALSATLQASVLKATGRYDYRVIEHDDRHCIIAFYRLCRGGAYHVVVDGEAITAHPDPLWEFINYSQFDMDDARRANLLKPNSNWDKWPRNMVFARALTNGIKWYAPDAMGGAPVYTPDELNPDIMLTEAGDPVDIGALYVEPAGDGGAPAQPRQQAQPRGGGPQQGNRGGGRRGRQQADDGVPHSIRDAFIALAEWGATADYALPQDTVLEILGCATIAEVAKRFKDDYLAIVNTVRQAVTTRQAEASGTDPAPDVVPPDNAPDGGTPEQMAL